MIERLWWDRDAPVWISAAALPLSLASLAYRAGFALERARARPRRAPVPVISVGNVTVGGGGKTPVVAEIARRLAALGRKPAVLSRGYGRQSRADVEVTKVTSAREGGDEPVLLARRGLRVFAGARRTTLIPFALAAGCDVLLLDDGLQHHALARDLDVVVLDGSNVAGNGRLLPRGPLREPLEAALRRARRSLIWLTRADLPRDPRAPEAAIESVYEPAQVRELRGARAFLFAGIARPESFERTARTQAREIAGVRWFRDHHAFTPQELHALRREAQRAGAQVLVTTEKDLVRIDAGELPGPPPIVALPVAVRITRGADVLDAVLREVAGA